METKELLHLRGERLCTFIMQAAYLVFFWIPVYIQGQEQDCNDGYWGYDCTSVCPYNCQKCNRYNGNYCSECQAGYYGYACQLDCSVGCANKSCNYPYGHCLSCVDGYRDNYCNQTCSEGCANDTCNQQNALCKHGCKEGYFGINCCRPGWYGWSCEIKCKENCFSCASLLQCESCKTGFYGSLCESKCPDNCVTCTAFNEIKCQRCIEGFYGSMCESSCPVNCYTCTSMSNCSACKTGFGGTICKTPCPENCITCDESQKCLTCKEGFLRPDKECQCIKGLCTSSKCMSCANSTYYADGQTCCPCNSKCKNAACLSAVHCTHGCEDGLFGPQCELQCTQADVACSVCSGESYDAFVCNSCRNGYYPDTNENGKCVPCSRTCVDGKCSSSNGHCQNGCQEGFWKSKCDINCKANCSVCDQNRGKCLMCSASSLYSSECDMYCNTCLNASCHMNGTCTDGCISDYVGLSCNTHCPTNCAHSSNTSRCSPETGRCLFGCNAGFTGDGCMEAVKVDNSKETVPTAALGGGIAAALTVAIVLAVGLFIYIRRRNQEPKKNESVQDASATADNSFASVYASVMRSENTGYVYENTPSIKASNATKHVRKPVYNNSPVDRNIVRHVNNVATEDSLEIDELDNLARQNAIRFEENGGVYYNNDNKVNKLKIPVAELQKFVMSKNIDYFKTEFEKLPYGLLKDYRVSQMKKNNSKNRYKGIYPYDDHRVKVRGGDTDYINASFIDGYKRRNEYIATLGPMSKQLGDFGAFWRMVWQQKVEKIVIVTNLVEEGKDKCEQYWPNVGASQMYGDIRVLCQSEDEYAEFTRRTLSVVKDKEERTLNQLHFTAWPDKDVPEDVTSIIEFRQKVIRAPALLGGPTIVHCSAGVGRTGTYIALDILTKEGKAESEVDIPGCVLNMRQCRPNMVQTAGQYEYLHQAVVHSLTFDCKPVAGERFQSYMDRTSNGQIMNMFHQLQGTTTYGPLGESEAVERNAKLTDKNREGSDIPGDEHRPKLYLNRKPGSSDYINAVFVNSFQTKNKYVLAQSPLPNTVADFLALVVQTNCACIVSFQSTSMHAKDIGVYVPADNQVLRKGIFTVRCSKPEANAYRIKRTLTIEHRANQAANEGSFLTHLEFTDWNTESNIPNSHSDFRRFIAEVEEVTANINSNKPVIIHCLDGASKCGLFCVVATLLQKMEVEHEVSVVNAVRKVKARRNGVIPNSEQFQFCHDCVLDYIQSFNIYSNFAADLSDC